MSGWRWATEPRVVTHSLLGAARSPKACAGSCRKLTVRVLVASQVKPTPGGQYCGAQTPDTPEAQERLCFALWLSPGSPPPTQSEEPAAWAAGLSEGEVKVRGVRSWD